MLLIPYGVGRSPLARVRELIKSELPYQVTPYVRLTQQGMRLTVDQPQIDPIGHLGGPARIVLRRTRIRNTVLFAVPDQDRTTGQLLNRISWFAPRSQAADSGHSGIVGDAERDPATH